MVNHPILGPATGLRSGRAEGGPQHLLGLRGHRRRPLHRRHGTAGAGGLGGPAKRLGPAMAGKAWRDGDLGMGKKLGKSHGNWEMKVGNAPFFLGLIRF